jgi:hypothetical protein
MKSKRIKKTKKIVVSYDEWNRLTRFESFFFAGRDQMKFESKKLLLKGREQKKTVCKFCVSLANEMTFLFKIIIDR